MGGSNPRLGPYFRILTFSTAVFCYIQLASSSAVPGVPWNCHGELIVCIFSSQTNFLSINPEHIVTSPLVSPKKKPYFGRHARYVLSATPVPAHQRAGS